MTTLKEKIKELKYTKPPWKIIKTDFDSKIFKKDNKIATVEIINNNIEEHDENTKIISLAPEMHRELIRLDHMAEKNCLVTGFVTLNKAEFDQIRKILNKIKE